MRRRALSDSASRDAAAAAAERDDGGWRPSRADPGAAWEGKQPGRGKNRAASVTSGFRRIRAAPSSLLLAGGRGWGSRGEEDVDAAPSSFSLNHIDAGGYSTVGLQPFLRYRRNEELMLSWMEVTALTVRLPLFPPRPWIACVI